MRMELTNEWRRRVRARARANRKFEWQKTNWKLLNRWMHDGGSGPYRAPISILKNRKSNERWVWARDSQQYNARAKSISSLRLNCVSADRSECVKMNWISWPFNPMRPTSNQFSNCTTNFIRTRFICVHFSWSCVQPFIFRPPDKSNSLLSRLLELNASVTTNKWSRLDEKSKW